jgi:predicted DNA binding CopG/RHH family protein
MSKKNDARTAAASTPTRTPHQELAREASDWDDRRRTPAGFVEDPSAVPRAPDATAISIRMPKALLVLLKKFAEREGIGYQVLIKRWLDDRVRAERDRMRASRADRRLSADRPRTPQFPLIDRDDERGHYQHG